MRPGVWQIVLVIVIIVLLFGARKLPDLARGVAQSLNIFKKEMSNDDPTVVQQPGVEAGNDTVAQPDDASRPQPYQTGRQAGKPQDPAQ